MYDLTLLFSEEEELNKIKENVTSLKGKITKEEKWGKKTLAYPIKKFSSLYYFNWTIEIPDDQIKELKKMFNFNEKLIRYLLLKVTR